MIIFLQNLTFVSCISPIVHQGLDRTCDGVAKDVLDCKTSLSSAVYLPLCTKGWIGLVMGLPKMSWIAKPHSRQAVYLPLCTKGWIGLVMGLPKMSWIAKKISIDTGQHRHWKTPSKKMRDALILIIASTKSFVPLITKSFAPLIQLFALLK